MHAHASVRVESVGGRPRLIELRSAPPLTVRPTPDPARPGLACVHVVGTSAAPLGGDELRLSVRVGPGAALEIGAVAAALAQPDPHGRRSALLVDVEIGEGGTLSWLGQPMIAVRGCLHRTRTVLRLADEASVLWRDELVLGRHAEGSGSVAQSLSVEVGRRPLLRTEVALGPAWPGSLGPGGAGCGSRSVGTVLVAGRAAQGADERWASRPDLCSAPAVRSAVMPLDGPGVLLQAVSWSPGSVSSLLDAAVTAVSPPYWRSCPG